MQLQMDALQGEKGTLNALVTDLQASVQALTVDQSQTLQQLTAVGSDVIGWKGKHDDAAKQLEEAQARHAATVATALKSSQVLAPIYPDQLWASSA